MKLILFISSYITVWLKLLRPSGLRRVAAENISLRQQLIAVTRNQKRAPSLTFWDKICFGILTSMIGPNRLSRIAIALKPATLLRFHKALVKKKYHWLYSNKSSKKPGPKGPEQAIIDVILEMKQRNPGYGYRRIAMQVSNAFGVTIDKDVVRRVLNKHYTSTPKDTGPSWLTFIGHMKDSLWSLDLFRCESIHLKTHWVMVIIDQFTRCIIGFAVYKASITGINLCCLFNRIISKQSLPKYLSSDNDPLFQFHRWQANLRILEIKEIKSLPFVPNSHPYIERLISSIRRELLDKLLFWNANDLQNKLTLFQHYYNEERCHHGIGKKTPLTQAGEQSTNVISLNDYHWKKHCRGLFQLPVAV